MFFILVLAACTPTTTSSTPTNSPSGVSTDTPPISIPTRTLTSTPENGGDSNPLALQVGNNSPTNKISPKPSQDLPDNHIGVHAEGYFRYNDTDNLVYRNGFKWVRIQSLTDFWAEAGDQQDHVGHKIFTLEAIPPEVDVTISEYSTNGVNIVLGLWMGTGLAPYDTAFQSQAEIDQYNDYVRFVVSHFKDRIQYYEIWNELGVMKISAYANLIKQVVPVIRQEHPQAKIIIGALAGPWEYGHPGYDEYQRFSLDIDQLNELLVSGVASLVDGISWHPFYNNIAADPYYQDYPEMVTGIRELAESQGFTGEYFADELLWSTVVAEDWENGPPVSKYIAAKYYIRAITENRGLDVNVTINSWFQEDFMTPIYNLNNILAGAEPLVMNVSVESDLPNVRSYSFSLPDGGVLVAFWNNGDIFENDPGIEGSVTLPNFSASQAIGIDPYMGIKQELMIETVDGNLVIRDLLIKDYPIVIKFSY